MALSKIHLGRMLSDTLGSDKILDGTIANADVSPSAAVGVAKTGLMKSTEKTQIEQNIGLLGFKMAVNDSLTIFNLVDGVVDEFHDESGTDEGEGSNDTYCSSNDNYINTVTTPAAISAGFTTSTVTESDTSAAGTIPQGGYYRTGPIPSDQSPCGSKRRGSNATFGTFTVPTGMTSANIQVWGAGGGTTNSPCASGGGGGYAEGTLAVTSSQVLQISAGKGGYSWGPSGPAGIGPNSGGKISFFGGGQGGGGTGSGGGGTAGVFSVADDALDSAPEAYLIAGSGGGGGATGSSDPSFTSLAGTAGAGGGLVGESGAGGGNQVSENVYAGGGGDQEQGGTGGGMNEPGVGSAPLADGRGGNAPAPSIPVGTRPGGLFFGGRGAQFSGGGGGGYYGGGGGGFGASGSNIVDAGGGGGSSYHGHPQITSGSTEAGTSVTGGGTTQPGYVAGTNETTSAPNGPLAPAEDGFVLITGTSTTTTTSSTTIVSNAFTAGSAPSTSRIVVFQEDVGSITLNTDIIASISRDGGSNFTNVTLADEGYVTGSSGQRILSGVATVSGQPSGTSMRWKLALANNQSKVHGVSLSWA